MSSHDHLVIMLHGIGASGAQLMPLASSWRTGLPNIRFAAPDAPFRHRNGHECFQPKATRSTRRVFEQHERRSTSW
jgi:phospholipase/carboxylesterase